MAKPALPASASLLIEWTPQLEANLSEILKRYRRASRSHFRNVGTPAGLVYALGEERALHQETLIQIENALRDAQSPIIDCEVVAAVDRLAMTAATMREERL
ncbi:MAG TPA: hypothetical protein VF614_00995 [Chthoniobacteraceae bacterium]|jgi:hypothetical protein